MHAKKTPRNAPCPCGSGRKYKHCCGKVSSQVKGDSLSASFVQLPLKTRVFYLDTCVWSALAKSEAARAGSIRFFQSGDRVAALSHFGLFELSRAPKVFPESDSLLRQLRHQVSIPSLYDEVIESEMGNFPRTWRMRWLSLSLLVDENNPRILQTLASKPHFVKSRDEHYQFGLDHFMSLEELKENFPPSHGDEYTVDDANAFAWGNAIDYLRRHFPRFLKSHWRYIHKREFESLASLFSLRIRSLFLFFKYYLHGQSPGASDFLDFAHVSYAPYCSVFITERNACNVLNRIKSNGLMLANTEILHISDFLERMSEVPNSA